MTFADKLRLIPTIPEDAKIDEYIDGRIDMVIECPKAIYIMEFKYSPNDKDLSNDALDQIKDKKYYQPYIIQQKTIVGIGYSFGEGTREITNFMDEALYQPELNLENRVL